MTMRLTTNYEKIRVWIEDHGGFPARIKGVPSDENDEIEISFDPENKDLERVEWDELFAWIERHELALSYDTAKNPGPGRFEFVDREEAGNEKDTGLPDSGDPRVFRQNIVPDSD